MGFITDTFKFIVRYRLHMGLLAAMTAIVPFQSSADGIVNPDGINYIAILAALVAGVLVTLVDLSKKITALGLKNIAPAAFYALCVAMPYALLASDAVTTVLILHAVSAFTMIMLHEMLGDIRDMRADKAANIRTLPNTFGINATKVIAVILMALYVAYIYVVTGVPSANLPPTFVVMAAIFLVGNDRRSWWYYQSYIFLWLVIVAIDLFV